MHTPIGRFSVCAVLTLAAMASGCGMGTTRLDEAVLVGEGPLRLKVVRYFERLPFSAWGEVAVVQCASDVTRERPAGATNDAGWVILDRFVALNTRSAAEVSGKAGERLLLHDGKILVWNHGMVLSVTFDGCGSFARWDARQLPAELTLPARHPDYCRPSGPVDCSSYDHRFIGGRMPVFSAIKARPSGSIAFEVRSAAFANGRPMHVHSTDFGRTWQLRHE